MTPKGGALVYYETDPIGIPIEAPTKYIRMLDRNLGASRLHDGYLNTCDADYDACGYTYVWGRMEPMSTPNMHIKATPNSALTGYGWENGKGYEVRTPADTWNWGETDPASNPCPAGYALPARLDMSSLLLWIKAKEGLPDEAQSPVRLEHAYKYLRLTPTGYRSAGNGTWATDNDKGYFWCADPSGGNPNASGVFQAYMLQIKAISCTKNNTIVNNNNPINGGGGVRCVRITTTADE